MKKLSMLLAMSLFCISLLGMEVPNNDEFEENKFQDFSQLQEMLEQKEVKIWKALPAIGISMGKFCRLRAELRKDTIEWEEKTENKVSQETYNFVCPILQEFGLDPLNIKIISDDTLEGDACVSLESLTINEPLFNQNSEKVRRFIIGHEIQHIINEDFLTCVTIKRLLPEVYRNTLFDDSKCCIKSSCDKDHPYLQLCRFQEERADALAALKNKEYAEGFYYFAYGHLKERRDNADLGMTHPSPRDRFAMAENIFHRIY
jgi:hypothetical protein